MVKSKKMAALGRTGGLRGGPARARSLSSDRRSEIARRAASKRWHFSKVVDRTPRTSGELRGYVAFYGSRHAKVTAKCSLEAVVLKAAKAVRNDATLARMLPVFLWRLRDKLDWEALAKKVPASHAPTLGYFLQLAGRLGSYGGFGPVIARLRPHVPPKPEYFFARQRTNVFSAMLADERTPTDAREWGLLTGTPTDSFESYFRKVAVL